jgi:hypothetical protein
MAQTPHHQLPIWRDAMRLVVVLEKAVRVNSAVAARIVLLRDVARATPEAPALHVLQTEEVAALVHHFGKKNRWRLNHSRSVRRCSGSVDWEDI